MKLPKFDSHITAATLIALGIVCLGLCIKAGINDFTNKDRRVVVKGLAEKEVNADKVTWPIRSNELGNDLAELYDRIGDTQTKIKRFLLANGVKESEISLGAPKVVDLKADQYSSEQKSYRYKITSTLTVTSSNVELVRGIISRQGELLKDGVAVVGADYEAPVVYEYTAFKDMKPKMMEEAIANAETTAQQFAKNSKSRVGKIISADQGQFSIEDRDTETPHIKKVRVVTTVTYSLKD